MQFLLRAAVLNANLPRHLAIAATVYIAISTASASPSLPASQSYQLHRPHQWHVRKHCQTMRQSFLVSSQLCDFPCPRIWHGPKDPTCTLREQQCRVGGGRPEALSVPDPGGCAKDLITSKELCRRQASGSCQVSTFSSGCQLQLQTRRGFRGFEGHGRFQH